MNKATTWFSLGLKIFLGVTTGYFVFKATEAKADELVQNSDSIIGAMAIGSGQAALASAAGITAFYLS